MNGPRQKRKRAAPVGARAVDGAPARPQRCRASGQGAGDPRRRARRLRRERLRAGAARGGGGAGGRRQGHHLPVLPLEAGAVRGADPHRHRRLDRSGGRRGCGARPPVRSRRAWPLYPHAPADPGDPAQGDPPPRHRRIGALPGARRVLLPRGRGARHGAAARRRRAGGPARRAVLRRARPLSPARRRAGPRRLPLGDAVRALREARCRGDARGASRASAAPPEGEAMKAARIAAILAILVAAGGGAYWWMSADEDGPKGFQGYVEGNLVYMAPEEGGRIETMAVEAGDEAREGDLLFGLESSMQIAQKNEAEARLRQAEAQLANLKAAMQRPEQIAVLRAQEERAKAQAQFSRNEHERQQTLFQRGIAAKAQLDNAKAALDRDLAGLEERSARSSRHSSPAAPARSAPRKRRCAPPRRRWRRPRRGSPGAALPRPPTPRCRTCSSGPARS